ncbi:MAG: Ig-like domain-containing protein [Patescibacteria group bacterium]|nr:MAG: Ig-like domain-containing protein [Patescibacteria group bacterium]
MHHPRFLLAIASLGLLATVLPVSAASGDVSSIALRDFNRNGKIDRAVITFANPGATAWTVRGTSGLSVTYKGETLAISDVFVASSADPAVLEVVLDESDARLVVDTAAEHFEVIYAQVGASLGVSNGSVELAAIPSGDETTAQTEIDQAAPILVSSTPVPGMIEYLRTEDLTLVFSEPVVNDSIAVSSSVNPGSWFLTSIGDGRTVTVQHDAYPRSANETFGVSAKDFSGNNLVTNAYPNPFPFQTSNDSSPNTRIDPLFLLSSPLAQTTLPSGELALLAWYSNMSSADTVRLSYSLDAGQHWQTIASVPASQKTHMWMPPIASGTLWLRAEALDTNGSYVNLATVGPLSVTGGTAPTGLRLLSAPELSQPSATTASALLRLDRAPSSASFSCNGGAVTAPVLATGDRPVRLAASLSGLADGTTYACAFALTDGTNPQLSLSVPSFVAGEDVKAPELTGPAAIDAFDASNGSARLTWSTNEITTATVSYGAYLNYGGMAASQTLAATHSVLMTGLTPGAMHQARITSIDAKGNASVSKDFYFVFLRENDLIKGSGPAVYWYKGGKRYAFPNLDTYRSWYGDDFSKVLRVPDTQLGTIMLGGNVTMKAGVYMIKIQSDPKTYAVEANGVLRWIPTEDRARALYGAAWATRVRDIDVSLFTDYTIGDPL